MRRAWVYGFVASLALALPAAGAATRSEVYGWLEALGSAMAATAPPAGQDAKGDFQLDQALALLAQPERTKKPGR